eukprot:TRINITY_DN334_c0_g1_i1.p1 TRINITY_DN334_c0_g1~~TRINITY_DN334_c0_g1_i1.p1  ORF type:complete len:350 (-),score=87.36 TRINITY_DN334_c0_g1_i1:92-1057(-)
MLASASVAAARRSQAFRPLALAAVGAETRLTGCNGAQETQSRGAATLKALQGRMRSIKNMQKITKAMKMVATAKFKKDSAALEAGLPFTAPVTTLFGRLGREDNKSGSLTYMAVTSDKGLCGGVNTQVCKAIRLGIAEEEAKGNTVKVMVMGGKGVAGLKRLYGDRFTRSFEDLGKVPWSFATASIIAERVIQANPQRLSVVSNEFKNMVSYETNSAHALTMEEATMYDKAEWSKAMDVYSFEPSIYEVWADLHEFYYGNVIYGAFLNGTVTETAQRMSAMENASKNAGEIFGKVQLQFNRARQAKITTELCEIISGASAV